MSKIIKHTAIGGQPIIIGDPGKKILSAEEQTRLKTEKILKQAQEEARRIINNAERLAEEKQNNAEKILEEAQITREKMLLEAKREGLLQGQKQGREELKKSSQELLLFLQRVIEEAQKIMQEQINHNAKKMVDLALHVAEKIVQVEIARDENMVIKIVKKALEEAREREKINIRVNPEDLHLLKTYQKELIEEFVDIRTLTFEEDARIERGGCIIETSGGDIDAQINRQLEEATKLIEGE